MPIIFESIGLVRWMDGEQKQEGGSAITFQRWLSGTRRSALPSDASPGLQLQRSQHSKESKIVQTHARREAPTYHVGKGI